MYQLRTAVYAGMLVIGTVVVSIIISPTLLLGEAATRRAVKLWARYSLFMLRVICGIRYRVEGREFIPEGGALVAANHQSMWETIALVLLLDKPVLVFKKELLKVPVYGWWALRAGSIPVDRSAGVKALNALTKAARAKLDAGCQIVVFPEGTRARPDQRPPLQPGVASIYLTTRTPCTPVVHDSGRFWRYPGGVTALKTPGLITVRFLPPIAPGMTRKRFMAALAARLHDGGSPISDTESAAAGGAAA